MPLNATTPNFVAQSITGLNTAVVNLFLLGGANLVFTTAANPNGEIRGQVYRLAREGYTISMNGSQERPMPNPSTAYGSGFVSMDGDQSNVHLFWHRVGLAAPLGAGTFTAASVTRLGR